MKSKMGFVTTLFLAHVAATLIMVGIIWFVQIVHYPLFRYVGVDVFAVYAAAHSRLTTAVVAPAMLVEAVTAMMLVWKTPEGIGATSAWMGLGLLGVIWLSTAFLQVPQHTVLTSGFNDAPMVLWSPRIGSALWPGARAAFWFSGWWRRRCAEASHGDIGTARSIPQRWALWERCSPRGVSSSMGSHILVS